MNSHNIANSNTNPEDTAAPCNGDHCMNLLEVSHLLQCMGIPIRRGSVDSTLFDPLADWNPHLTFTCARPTNTCNGLSYA